MKKKRDISKSCVSSSNLYSLFHHFSQKNSLFHKNQCKQNKKIELWKIIKKKSPNGIRTKKNIMCSIIPIWIFFYRKKIDASVQFEKETSIIDFIFFLLSTETREAKACRVHPKFRCHMLNLIPFSFFFLYFLSTNLYNFFFLVRMSEFSLSKLKN